MLHRITSELFLVPRNVARRVAARPKAIHAAGDEFQPTALEEIIYDYDEVTFLVKKRYVESLITRGRSLNLVNTDEDFKIADRIPHLQHSTRVQLHLRRGRLLK